MKLQAQDSNGNKTLHQLFEDYGEERLQLFPIIATFVGANRYNDLLPNDGSTKFLDAKHAFYTKYQDALKKFDYQRLNKQDRISWDILMHIIERELGAEKFHKEYLPADQENSLALTIGSFGSGKGAQPFTTVNDYDNWLRRIAGFADWTDTAIANFRKGVKAGFVLPKALVVKIIPQMEYLAQVDTSKSIFYGPVRNFPKDFSATDKLRLAATYHHAITQQIIPAYQKLKDFFSYEYLPQARTSSGINVLPNGDEMYRFYTYYYTTTSKTPEELYQTGLKEITRIKSEMEKIKNSVGFKGSLRDLFEFMKNDTRFMPFKTTGEVLNAYWAIFNKIQPHLKNLFDISPKTSFEIREAEAFRTGAYYVGGSPDGTRPGIFYVHVTDPSKINVTNTPMESSFLHEAIPGHHFQTSLQWENMELPKFRRQGLISAFSEGWGLYAESLGDQLGCYQDPYQKLGALSSEIYRAVRLVVDMGIHKGKMTREEAINFMTDHIVMSEQKAISEVERYMAWPGQALSYKTGELKIKELRDKYQQLLGNKFDLKNFHTTLLKAGAMPLEIFEKYMDDWAVTQKSYKKR